MFAFLPVLVTLHDLYPAVRLLLQHLWTLFNVALLLFFGVLHQGSVVSTLMHFQSSTFLRVPLLSNGSAAAEFGSGSHPFGRVGLFGTGPSDVREFISLIVSREVLRQGSDSVDRKGQRTDGPSGGGLSENGAASNASSGSASLSTGTFHGRIDVFYFHTYSPPLSLLVHPPPHGFDSASDTAHAGSAEDSWGGDVDKASKKKNKKGKKRKQKAPFDLRVHEVNGSPRYLYDRIIQTIHQVNPGFRGQFSANPRLTTETKASPNIVFVVSPATVDFSMYDVFYAESRDREADGSYGGGAQCHADGRGCQAGTGVSDRAPLPRQHLLQLIHSEYPHFSTEDMPRGVDLSDLLGQLALNTYFFNQSMLVPANAW